MAGGPPALTRLPGRVFLQALAQGTRRQAQREWAGTPMHRWLLARPRPEGLAADPHDPRPVDPEAGRRILDGRFVFGGATLETGTRGDPWDRPSPTRRFAALLHRFDWMPDLLATGEAGAAEGLRLTLDWSRVFGRWNGFSWAPEVLERRTFNLACAVHTLCARASDAETALITLDLARQARHLLSSIEGPVRAAERAAAATLAGTALSGEAGEQLVDRGLIRLERALYATVQPDGGHASRSPRAALELLLDLQALDEALVQRGIAAPDEMMRAMDRLTGAIRFFTLADGCLPDLQGGEAGRRPYVAAARASEEAPARPPAARNGYQRLESRSLQILADCAPPAQGPWSVTACAQPLALEVLAAGRRMIVACGWSPEANGPQALRLADAASTVSVGDASCGEPLRGFRAGALGPRLVDAYETVAAQRHETREALWLEMSHDGWVPRFGLRHERRLFLDLIADELRGEDRLVPAEGAAGDHDGRRFVPFMVRFHVHPEVRASLARDGKSVLLRAEGDETGWWLRNDAQEVAVETSVYFQDGLPKRTHQIVLRGNARLDAGARVRWKLAAAEAWPPPH
ncbi:heparinase II/III family protein [Phenylobacterium sp.]|uniref:heparinase II/III family protein n=1 Tax=Phenylobacterium sp. TaxID=1871053 RepID=UPI00271F10B3|nr:heparinase II/III family protein [Phenylobacterium sp.]MDO8380165.1 heparinase II/III family protein [Phenylobacterium sp.]